MQRHSILYLAVALLLYSQVHILRSAAVVSDASVDLNEVRYVPKSTYDELYEDGKLAYTAKDWPLALEKFEAAVADYIAEKEGMAACYTRCRSNDSLSTSQDERAVMRRLAEQARCAEACKRTRLGLRGRVMPALRKEFEMAYPYHYIQFCYYQIGDVKSAATAALTYSLFNPDDPDMQDNLKLYEQNADVQASTLEPRLTPSGQIFFDRAAAFYHQKLYKLAGQTMQSAVKTFVEEYHVCHSNCDSAASVYVAEEADERDEHSQTFLDLALRLHLKQVACRLQCWIHVGHGVERYHPLEVVPDAYNYIHFALNSDNDLVGAVQAAVDYLHLKPHDAVMQGNLMFYKSKDVNTDDLAPSELVFNVAKQVAEDRYLLGLLKQSRRQTEEDAFREEVGIGDPNAGEDVEKVFEEFATLQRQAVRDVGAGPVDTNGTKPVVRSKKDVSEAAKVSPVAGDDEIVYEEEEEVAEVADLMDYKVLESPAMHGGLSRVLLDGMATDEECQALLDLAKEGKPGSGYGGRPSPHTTNELFEGLTVDEAAQGAKNGKLDISSVILYLDLAEKSRAFLEKYFQLETLYFSYSHLVCRTSLIKSVDGVKVDELNLSHPIHADNCILKEDGSCVKESPAYTWRDYSAILYLNDDFIGGDFFYAHRGNQTVQHRVRPSCGRLAGFGAGESNLHGVLPLLSGRRCVIALWFTLQPNKDEGDHAATFRTLGRLRDMHAASKARDSKEATAHVGGEL